MCHSVARQSLEGDVMNVDERNRNGWHDLDLAPDEFQKLGYQVIDIITEYYKEVDSFPVFPPRTSEEVSREFSEPLPRQGQEAASIIDEWAAKILPNATHLGSPRYFGFVNGSGTMGSTNKLTE
jgi:hypothetical protein